MDIPTVTVIGCCVLCALAVAQEVSVDEAPGRAIATTMAFCASLIAVSEIVAHLRSYHQPERQRYVIRVLLMVPIYALDSLGGFFDRGHSGSFDLARDTYEAYVIYNFFHLLLDLCGGYEGASRYWSAMKPMMPHMFPLRGQMVLNRDAIDLWRFFMMQYVVVSPTLTLITYVLSARNEYDEASWSMEGTHLWIAVLRCISVTFAFTALLYFYLATKYHIHDKNPTGKFMSIKAVVFLGCWQGVAISVLQVFRVFPETAVREFLFRPSDPVTADAAVAALENWLTIAEMFVAAIAHHFVFSYKGFPRLSGGGTNRGVAGRGAYVAGPTGPRRVNVAGGGETSFLENVLHAFSVADVAQHALVTAGNGASVAKRRAAAADADEALYKPTSGPRRR